MKLPQTNSALPDTTQLKHTEDQIIKHKVNEKNQ
jgi:hypothetical protein